MSTPQRVDRQISRSALMRLYMADNDPRSYPGTREGDVAVCVYVVEGEPDAVYCTQYEGVRSQPVAAAVFFSVPVDLWRSVEKLLY